MTPNTRLASASRTAPPITITVLLFSVLRERLGTRAIDVQLPSEATVSDLLDAVCTRYPTVRHFRQTLRVAVNSEYAADGDPINAGDEIALITPVSGG